MSYTVASILDRVRARLNDANTDIFTNLALMPFAQDAADELQLELELHGILVLEKISTALTITASTSQITIDSTTTPALPTDMLEPQRMEERLSGSSDLYQPMIARMWPPDILPTDSLRYWDYREQAIHFVGCTSARQVKIYYLKRALNITTTTDVIDVNNSQLFMITRTAALAARDIGENPTRADELDKEAQMILFKMTGIGVKNKQRTRTRRRPFQLSRKGWW